MKPSQVEQQLMKRTCFSFWRMATPEGTVADLCSFLGVNDELRLGSTLPVPVFLNVCCVPIYTQSV